MRQDDHAVGAAQADPLRRLHKEGSRSVDGDINTCLKVGIYGLTTVIGLWAALMLIAWIVL